MMVPMTRFDGLRRPAGDNLGSTCRETPTPRDRQTTCISGAYPGREFVVTCQKLRLSCV